jgi:hypothetical protein
MLAAPVIVEKPTLVLGDHNVRDYYAYQILQISDPRSPRYVGKVSELDSKLGVRICQHTVEGAALTLGLMATKAVLWDKFNKAQQDQVAALLSDFAHSRTNGHNWRFFNVMMGTFLKLHGYSMDETIYQDHLRNLAAYYDGDGWYRDHAAFDFYSAWAFQFYAPLWCAWYGFRRQPDLARIFARRHAELMRTYHLLFSREGHSLLWGRSGIYRCAASVPFAAHFLLRERTIAPGFARRICSGNLLQFLARKDWLVNGIPCLGFYGPFAPMLQGYSCAASPFWISKLPFMALLLPADSPFWTAVESEGPWRALGTKSRTVALNGPGLALTVHGSTGAAELRNARVTARQSDPNYSRLAYNTAFPWEADSKETGASSTRPSPAPGISCMPAGATASSTGRRTCRGGWDAWTWPTSSSPAACCAWTGCAPRRPMNFIWATSASRTGTAMRRRSGA